MQRLVRVLALVLLSSLLVFVTPAAAPARAQEDHRESGQIVFGRDVTLESGETVDGDLVVFGGSLMTRADSRIVGDAVVFGGSITIAGQVTGDVTAIGGNVDLAPTARVQGDAVALGGRVQRDAGAQLLGQRVETGRFDPARWLSAPGGVGLPFATARAASFDAVAAFLRLFRAALTSLIVAVIGLLVVLFLPEHSRVIGGTITDATAASFGTGFLTLIVGVALIAVLVITICLAPLGLLLALPLVLATLLGWVVTGYILGQRVMPLLKREATPAPYVTALVGVLILTGVQQGLTVLGDLPCLGFFFWLLGAILWLVAASVGLGAVVLSRFGSQHYPAAPMATGVSPSTPLPPAAGGEDSPEGGAAPTGPTDEVSDSAADELAPVNQEVPAPEPESGAARPRRRTPRRKTTEDPGISDSGTERSDD
jgi:cytoskeletal protein CcmA (bactofilin family)